jgi:hypothetical protein
MLMRALKADAAELLSQRAEPRGPGASRRTVEGKAVRQDVASYEQTPGRSHVVKVLALRLQDIEAGWGTPAADVVVDVRSRRGDMNPEA